MIGYKHTPKFALVMAGLAIAITAAKVNRGVQASEHESTTIYSPHVVGWVMRPDGESVYPLGMSDSMYGALMYDRESDCQVAADALLERISVSLDVMGSTEYSLVAGCTPHVLPTVDFDDAPIEAVDGEREA